LTAPHFWNFLNGLSFCRFVPQIKISSIFAIKIRF